MAINWNAALSPKYRITVRDAALNDIAEVDSFQQLTMQSKVNQVGAWVLELPGAADETVTFTTERTYNQTVMLDGPEVYYRLNEAAGTATADSSGHARTGTYAAGVTLGQASLLTGNPDTAVLLSNG